MITINSKQEILPTERVVDLRTDNAGDFAEKLREKQELQQMKHKLDQLKELFVLKTYLL